MTEFIIHRDGELTHYGVPGTKWGIRRYQNLDGSYKPGAEGRYYQPVTGTKKNISTNGGGTSASSKSPSTSARKLHASRGSVIEEGQKKTSGGGGGSKPADKDKENEKTEEEKKENSEKPMDKTADGKDIKLYSVDEKLDTTKNSDKKKKSSTSSEKQQTEAEFKVSQLLDKIENFFDMDDMTEEDWEDMDLDDSDIKEIDDLVKKYREWRTGNKSNTKKTKKIDLFIERYEAWKSSHGKHSELYEEYLMHHGIFGMKWGIRRYQNPDGTLTDAGKKRYSKLLDKAKKTENEFNSRPKGKNYVKTKKAEAELVKYLDKTTKMDEKIEKTYKPFEKEYKKANRALIGKNKKVQKVVDEWNRVYDKLLTESINDLGFEQNSYEANMAKEYVSRMYTRRFK